MSLQVSELEAQLLHLLQARNCSPDSTPKGSVSEHATLPQTGLAPPASDSFKVPSFTQPDCFLPLLPTGFWEMYSVLPLLILSAN